jgi:hypothetical protein
MNERFANRLALRWMPVYDKLHYPLKGISLVFFQNLLEMIFLVGFVWYLNWSPLLVFVCCVVESFAVWFCSVWKSKTSFGVLQHRQVSLFVVTGLVLLILVSSATFLLWKLTPYYFSQAAFMSLIWNDQEFLFCLLAIILQQVLEFFKYKKISLYLPADRLDTFINPVAKLLMQQVVLCLLIIMLLFLPHTTSFVQAMSMALLWMGSKVVLGQVGVSY